MRIAEVESFVAAGFHFVRIRTDDGTTGIGQSAAWAFPEVVDAATKAFEPHLVGQDAGRIEWHWQHLHGIGSLRSSILSAALSAIDIALWDLQGKRREAPIWELLGGAYRERIRLHLLLPPGSPQELSAAARQGAEAGFTAVKFDPLPDDCRELSIARLCATVAERVDAVRTAMGADVDIIVELHRKLTPLQFPSVVAAVREFRPMCVEDPIRIDSISMQGELARRADVPVAQGERLHTIWEFRELLESGGPQIVRPDLGLAGGFSQCRKIAALAEAHDSTISPHNFLGPLLTMATAHLGVALPNFATLEYSSIDEGPMAAAFTGALTREGGHLPRSDAPGLGIDVDLSKLAEIFPDGWNPAMSWGLSDASQADSFTVEDE